MSDDKDYLVPVNRPDNPKVKRNTKTKLFVSDYTMEIKDKAIMVYIVSGSMQKVSKILDIPYRTLQQWTTTDWFKERYAELKKRYNTQTDAKYTALLQQTSKQLEQRLIKGDPVVLRSGDIVYKPVSAKELASISEQIYRILALLRGEPTQITERVTVKERLEGIAEGLLQGSKKINADTDKKVH